MATLNKAINAGVHGSVGVEFQKHCALYLLFDKYALIKDRNYFICLEHHDDILFCYQTQTDLMEAIDAYQAKKSSAPWGMGNELSVIIKKLTEVGIDLFEDSYPKDAKYSHTLNFITNDSIKLHCGKKTKKKTLLINEGNYHVSYIDIDSDIRTNVLEELKKISVTDAKRLTELDKLALIYIDLPKKAKGQKDSLVGQFNRIFGDRVTDPVAAIDSLLLLFRNAENVLNNGNVAQLLDVSKRINSKEITEALKIITTEAKAYELWRTLGNELAKKLAIPVFEQEHFRLQFQNSLDLFKDLKQVEHQRIYKYVISNKTKWSHHVDDIECIHYIYVNFIADKSTNLNELDVKAAVYAAYVSLKG